ncbi:ABC transporter ATP-binding protein [Chloroflexota bacterium]
MSFIETRDLCQRYNERDTLKNINIRVERGEVFALIGPTGAGKTTLLRLIDLLDLPASGGIYFDGRDVTESGRRKLETRRRMAFVLQKPVVFNMSVYDNIAYGLKWRGTERNSIHKRVSSILETVGLHSYKDRNARTLSGGEVQRVAIARAIVSEPELLLLDEPTANLDPISSAKVEEIIANIIQRYDTTIIMATHDMSQGQRLADMVSVLLNGEIMQTGDWRRVFNSPRNREVAGFVGVENILDGKILSSDNKIVTIGIGSNIIEAISDCSIDEEVYVCLRAEDITLSTLKTKSSARNSVTGAVTRAVSTGPVTRIEINCGFPLVCLITKRSAEELDLVKGKQVYATFKATAVHAIKKGAIEPG